MTEAEHWAAEIAAAEGKKAKDGEIRSAMAAAIGELPDPTPPIEWGGTLHPFRDGSWLWISAWTAEPVTEEEGLRRLEAGRRWAEDDEAP